MGPIRETTLCREQGDVGRDVHQVLKDCSVYLLDTEPCQETMAAVQKLGKNNKTTPSARAGNALIHFWLTH